ncbi:PREDICTED: uncharacterized protein LOC104751428 [Camelina sativa]|uniref:Uncharacterized protein LOC104751428 n=1 Tax=Camelina sativa TaxID=90675 RepID=A0ABM0WIS8_CAMSA|nr:PREDICTED: uncharacterized protein LOC104751428 [Camelina sativa]
MVFQWLPEDDYVLIKSLEDGTSLETLAKGAVRFSRKFTLSELKDRWHCLLYNPKVTSLSSSVGFELQYGAQFNPQGHYYHSIPVRTQYYTAQKKRRLELQESLKVNNNVIDEHHYVDDGGMFEEYDDFTFKFEDIENFQKAFPDIMLSSHDDQQDVNYQTTMFGNDDDVRMVDQMLNINNEQIQDCDVTVLATTIDHVMLQEVFQDPLFQQPNTSFNEIISQSHEQVSPDEAEIWNPLQSYQGLPDIGEEACRMVVPLCELDPHPEIINGVIICVLNRESDEIPDNDDINLKLNNCKARNSSNPSSSSSLRKHIKPSLPSTSSQAKGNNSVDSYGLGDCAVTTQASCSSASSGSSSEKEKSTVSAITSSSLQNSPDTEICDQTLSAKIDINASEEKYNEVESDEDLPSFSDVEAMIFDMDLEPIGQDRYELEATRYRNEDMARMIMRLEQSAESFVSRDISAHGAFALLYGSTKHYINKPEVLLGRVTGEYPVDIDLGSSGSKTKFSRRQALIMLKQNGCFEIKNLGKFSIWINDHEINHGEIVALKNSCLIQIREISFIFEMNEKAVKKYLNGFLK